MYKEAGYIIISSDYFDDQQTMYLNSNQVNELFNVDPHIHRLYKRGQLS